LIGIHIHCRQLPMKKLKFAVSTMLSCAVRLSSTRMCRLASVNTSELQYLQGTRWQQY
jgi:hypothetical protein